MVRDYQRIGRAEPVLASADPGALVRRVTEAMRAAPASRGLEITCEVEEAPPQCPLDEDLMSAALENLVRNAMEAMNGASGKRITLRVESDRGEQVVFTVADDGPGMDPRTRERATEAFFTTKAAGTGLGLAIVRKIVDQHAGRIAIEPGLPRLDGRGTAVRVALPRHAGEATPPPVVRAVR